MEDWGVLECAAIFSCHRAEGFHLVDGLSVDLAEQHLTVKRLQLLLKACLRRLGDLGFRLGLSLGGRLVRALAYRLVSFN